MHFYLEVMKNHPDTLKNAMNEFNDIVVEWRDLEN